MRFLQGSHRSARRMSSLNLRSSFQEAAVLLADSDGLIITSGAGMGVDSGLPDFSRSNTGFWKAYPALASYSFQEVANPTAFTSNPELEWGFYGHRLNLYRKTEPNAGFSILRAIAKKLTHGYFVFTSNVDGQFQKAGFGEDRIHEVHGSIHYLQCIMGCNNEILSAQDFHPEVNESECILISPLPKCRNCRNLLRPTC